MNIEKNEWKLVVSVFLFLAIQTYGVITKNLVLISIMSMMFFSILILSDLRGKNEHRKETV